MSFREPQTPGLGGIDELTPAEEAIIQAIRAGTYFIFNIAPSGVIDGSNTVFTLPGSPNPANSLRLYVNGARQKEGSGNEYILSGGTITLSIAPPAGSIITADYTVDPN